MQHTTQNHQQPPDLWYTRHGHKMQGALVESEHCTLLFAAPPVSQSQQCMQYSVVLRILTSWGLEPAQRIQGDMICDLGDAPQQFDVAAKGLFGVTPKSNLGLQNCTSPTAMVREPLWILSFVHGCFRAASGLLHAPLHGSVALAVWAFVAILLP